MPESLVSYVAGGCGDEQTQEANVAAFDKWGLMPADVRRRQAARPFGRALRHEAAVAIVHEPERRHRALRPGRSWRSRDRARRRADRRADGRFDPFGRSARSCRGRVQGEPGFFQLYTPTDRELAASLVRRAEQAGFKAIVVTLDTWVTGWRPRDLKTANFPQLRGHCLANYFTDPRFAQLLGGPPEKDLRAAVMHVGAIFGNPLTWDDLPWLRSLTKLPLIVKGICHPDDARRAIDGGVDGIYCSNHGGRQANGGIPALDMLPAVVKAAGATPVLFDSGVRSGTHIVKALAMGAAAVGIGRPYAYGLALGGTEELSTCCVRSWPKPISSWRSTAIPPSPISSPRRCKGWSDRVDSRPTRGGA